MSAFLLIVIGLAVTALQVGGHRFFLTAKDRVTVGYELQYAIEHIYEHVVTGVGNVSDPAIDIVSSMEFRVEYIDKFDVAGSPKFCHYKIDNNEASPTYQEFLFDKDNDGTPDESLGTQVDFVPGECEFAMVNNLFRIKLTADFPLPRQDEAKQRLTLYSASYPRCASFN